VVYPGVFLILTVLAGNLFGDPFAIASIPGSAG
jgi:ABC-type dipeptide/oligopeptide/nickel transport system permease subunit